MQPLLVDHRSHIFPQLTVVQVVVQRIIQVQTRQVLVQLVKDYPAGLVMMVLPLGLIPVVVVAVPVQ